LAGRRRKRGRRERPSPRPPAAAATTARDKRSPTAARDRPSATTSRDKPAPAAVAAAPKRGGLAARYEDRNAAVRATLTPLAHGERPVAVTVGAGLAALSGVGNLIAYLAGAKIAGKHPAPGGIIVFSVLMLVCAVGMWRVRYWAVLGFMALLAIVITLFALLLIEASNLLGFLVPPVIIAGCGYLFMRLVRALSRIQMPKYPSR
jgi:hypothetical protein